MFRRRLRSGRSGRAMRWSKETTLVAAEQTINAGATGNFVAIPSIAGQGVRKVRSISVKINSNFSYPMPIALVFVPAGTVPNAMGSGSICVFPGTYPDQTDPNTPPTTGNLSSMYEPNQNVLAVSQVPANASETLTLYYSGTREIGSGDAIACVYKNFTKAAMTGQMLITVTYLIGY